MTSLLLFISFTLHIVLLTAVFMLYQQLQKLRTTQREQLRLTIDNFLEEIKAENDRLRASLQGEKTSEKLTTDHNVHLMNKWNDKIDKEIPKKEAAIVETSTEGQILQLHDQGYSIDEIAKRTKRGKTEVELIVKLTK